jgi:anti-sigma B factor antagonist
MAEISYIDSSWIGEIVSGFTALSGQDGALKLLKVPKRVLELPRITKLHAMFEIFDDEAQAIASFK